LLRCLTYTNYSCIHYQLPYLPSVDKCFVPSDALYQLARNRNLQPQQIVQYGLPIRKGFWSTAETKTKNKQTLRKDLSIDTELPTVLLVGGGDGMGGIVDIAKSLGEQLGSKSTIPAYQMVVVCGNNKKAKESLSNVDFGQGVKVIVQGFVNNMDEWMQAADALVTKAGPGTIAEASICGLPCMLFSYLYVCVKLFQESKNVHSLTLPPIFCSMRQMLFQSWPRRR
jgi:1,2-diacylglycerol 3-beta-galactosyltransferase